MPVLAGRKNLIMMNQVGKNYAEIPLVHIKEIDAGSGHETSLRHENDLNGLVEMRWYMCGFLFYNLQMIGAFFIYGNHKSPSFFIHDYTR